MGIPLNMSRPMNPEPNTPQHWCSEFMESLEAKSLLWNQASNSLSPIEAAKAFWMAGWKNGAQGLASVAQERELAEEALRRHGFELGYVWDSLTWVPKEDRCEQIERLTKERDEAREVEARTKEAMRNLAASPGLPEEYEAELDRCDKAIQWCEENGNDWYGVNFHQGLRSGIISGHIIMSRERESLRRQLAEANVARDKAEVELKHHQEVMGAICLPAEVPESYANVRKERDELKAELAKERAEASRVKSSLRARLIMAFNKHDDLRRQLEEAEGTITVQHELMKTGEARGLSKASVELAEWHAVAQRQREALETARIYIEVLDCACGHYLDDDMEPCTRCMMVENLDEATTLSIDPPTALLEIVEAAWKAGALETGHPRCEHYMRLLEEKWLASKERARAMGGQP